MNLDEIKKFLADNKEEEDVKEFLGSLEVAQDATLEVFKSKVAEDDAFKAFMDSEKDKHHSKALKTWQENNLDAIVTDKIKEKYPDDDPKDIEVRDLRQQIEQVKNDAQLERMTNFGLTKASELGLPPELVKFLVTVDKEETDKNINLANGIWTQGIQNKVKNKLKGNGDNIPDTDEFTGIDKEDFMNMDFSDQQKYAEENPEAYKGIMED